MKASELIKELQRQIDKYGDLPVIHDLGWGDKGVSIVNTWTASGEVPDLRKKKTDPPVEIELL